MEIPEQEIEVGSLEEGKRYKVTLFEAGEVGSAEDVGSNSSEFTGQLSGTRQRQDNSTEFDQPPVDEGEIREVEIEDIGEKGDGIARIPPGYVVFVENTSPGDRVRIKITEARDNFAFADVVGQV
ncbi:TRAM domain-containing protein [Haloplanus pelagicus]|uniref:TRAM domain-containing protein n=1 Tax=Haloplanus pelagicus TaxID=2949995 RepID=UPI00203F8990|nr:TRAM domain-containing protein [Haloplanus sp. HW8-1]